MRALAFSDIHLESGLHLGGIDADYEHTRLRDAERVLSEIVADPHDVLIFGGDLGRTATPRPVAYRIMQRVLSASPAPKLLIMGNHDWTGSQEHTGLHVVAEGVDQAVVCTTPKLINVGDLQIGVIPWTPPTRLFDHAKHDPRGMNAAVAERLVGVAHLLAKQLDPERPSLLVLHWLLIGGKLGGGMDVGHISEPLVPVIDLEAMGWDAIIAGHNHQHQRISQRAWHIGPPLRTGFGEANLPTGYMRVTWEPGPVDGWGSPKCEHVSTQDRQLVLLDLDGAPADGRILPDVRDAIVRVRIRCDEQQAREWQGEMPGLVAALNTMGAFRVIGPLLQVQRERRVRSDLTVDVSPEAALEAWMAQQQITEPLAVMVRDEAKGLWT